MTHALRSLFPFSPLTEINRQIQWETFECMQIWKCFFQYCYTHRSRCDASIVVGETYWEGLLLHSLSIKTQVPDKDGRSICDDTHMGWTCGRLFFAGLSLKTQGLKSNVAPPFSSPLDVFCSVCAGTGADQSITKHLFISITADQLIDAIRLFHLRNYLEGQSGLLCPSKMFCWNFIKLELAHPNKNV